MRLTDIIAHISPGPVPMPKSLCTVVPKLNVARDNSTWHAPDGNRALVCIPSYQPRFLSGSFSFLFFNDGFYITRYA